MEIFKESILILVMNMIFKNINKRNFQILNKIRKIVKISFVVN